MRVLISNSDTRFKGTWDEIPHSNSVNYHPPYPGEKNQIMTNFEIKKFPKKVYFILTKRSKKAILVIV